MIKPTSLRAHLTAALPELAAHPERLLVFIEEGTLACTGSGTLAFEYRYRLAAILTEYAGHPDTVMVPLLAWLAAHQPELLHNRDRQNEIRFEAEILANDRVDLQISLPLTERVGVTTATGGGYTCTHFPEPSAEGYLFAEQWQLFLRDQLLASWAGVPPPDIRP